MEKCVSSDVGGTDSIGTNRLDTINEKLPREWQLNIATHLVELDQHYNMISRMPREEFGATTYI
jgi:hypothetical protein